MPVVIQQPSPMAPQTSVNAGRAQIATQDYPTVAQMYEAANRNQLEASRAAAQIASQAGMHAASLSAQASTQQEALRQRQREFEASQQPSERDQFMAAMQQQHLQQQAETQAWLQGQELSQQEEMHLQRMQAGVGAVMADDTLTDEEKHSLVAQLRTGIDPMKQRQENARAKQEQALTEKAIQEATRIESGRQAMDKFWAQNAPNGMVNLPDGSVIVRKANGDPLHIKPADTDRAEHDLPMSEANWLTHYEKVTDHVRKSEEAKVKKAQAAGDETASVDEGAVEQLSRNRRSNMGLGNTYAEYRAIHATRRHPTMPPPTPTAGEGSAAVQANTPPPPTAPPPQPVPQHLAREISDEERQKAQEILSKRAEAAKTDKQRQHSFRNDPFYYIPFLRRSD